MGARMAAILRPKIINDGCAQSQAWGRLVMAHHQLQGTQSPGGSSLFGVPLLAHTAQHHPCQTHPPPHLWLGNGIMHDNSSRRAWPSTCFARPAASAATTGRAATLTPSQSQYTASMQTRRWSLLACACSTECAGRKALPKQGLGASHRLRRQQQQQQQLRSSRSLRQHQNNKARERRGAVFFGLSGLPS